MAITTLNGIISGLQPPQYFLKPSVSTPGDGYEYTDLWAVNPTPAAGAYNTTLNGTTFTAPVTGQLGWLDAPGGQQAYLARFSASMNVSPFLNAGGLMLCDRIWQNQFASGTALQSITSPTWPARDANGTTNGEGCILLVESSTSGVDGTGQVNVIYTNSAGTGSRTTIGPPRQYAPNNVNEGYILGLQGGDTGVQSVQSVQVTGASAQAKRLLVVRPLAFLPLFKPRPSTIDAVVMGLPKLYAGSVLFLIQFQDPNASGTNSFMGSVQYTFG